MTPQIFGDGTMSIHFETQQDSQWKPIVTAQTDSVFEVYSLSGTYTLQGKEPTLLWKQGYQSWWWSGILNCLY